MADDGFHPNLGQSERLVRNRVHHVKSADIDADTAQSEGMQRFAAISGRTVGSEKLWMGETRVHPQAMSANHHHGESETAIFVLSGHPDFVFHDGEQEMRITTNPGDYVFIRFAGWKPLALPGEGDAAFLLEVLSVLAPMLLACAGFGCFLALIRRQYWPSIVATPGLCGIWP